MKEVHDRPTEGQWVEMWEYLGLPWSITYRVQDGQLQKFDEADDAFYQTSDDQLPGARFFVVDS